MAFVVGAVGTVLGTIVAFWLLGPRLGPDGYKVAAALCASYIGGSVNFAAVSRALALAPGPALAGAMAADNCVMAVYIAAIMSIPAADSSGSGGEAGGNSGPRPPAGVTAESLALSIAAAALACTLGNRLATAAGAASLGLALMALLASAFAMAGTQLAARLGGRASSSGGTSSTVRPAPFAGAEALGGALMMVFFATIGAAAGSLQALHGCGWLALFILVQLRCAMHSAEDVVPAGCQPHQPHTSAVPLPARSIHLAVCLAGGRLLRLPMQAVLIASNANGKEVQSRHSAGLAAAQVVAPAPWR